MKRYAFLLLLVSFVVISAISQQEEHKKEEEQYQCWDGQDHWYAPIYHFYEMYTPEFWEVWKEATEKEARDKELNARD